MSDLKIRKKVISDFDEQWKLQGELDNDYWSSDEIFLDLIANVFSIEEVSDKIIADIGAGTGRVLRIIFKFNPKKIFAIEPTDAGIKHIAKNMKEYKNLNIIKSNGLEFKTSELCDIIFFLGVLHHIKNPTDVLKNVRSNLKPKGKIIIWVYGYENNFLYIFIYKILSFFTKKFSDKLLYKFVVVLNIILIPYIFLCKFINLPLKNYFINVFNKFNWQRRNHVIFDQLNPNYSKYYKKSEIEKELIEAGFINLKFHHHHKYSWTVIGENI